MDVKLRRSMLFIPGNNPVMLQNGGVFGADSVILDLEDAVAPTEKDAARFLITHALRCVDYGDSEKVIRINPLDTFAAEDIKAIVPCRPDTILLPKVESVEDIQAAVRMIAAAELPNQTPVKIIALLETPRGIVEAYHIGKADPRVVALAFGGEDYTAGLGAIRTREGTEIFTARTIVVNAAAAADVQSIDTPYTDTNDEEGLFADTQLAKQLGFKGKMSINPRQIEIMHAVFNPSSSEIDWAQQVVFAIHKAQAEGSGVTSLHGKMIDLPIVNRAQRILQLAKLIGLLEGAKS